MRVEFHIRPRRGKGAAGPAELSSDCPLRAACLLALAHRFEGLLQTGAVRDYAELARLGHVSRARITQIMNLLDLAAPIQEHLLGVHPATGFPETITEKHLRRIVREIRWDRQLEIFHRRQSHENALTNDSSSSYHAGKHTRSQPLFCNTCPLRSLW
jgi:hypothetical protein